MKIFLAGYYGFNNIGDEAILESILVRLRMQYPDSDITVLSNDPHATIQCFNVNSVARSSGLKVIRSIWNSDVFILGGGGILQDVTSTRSLYYYLSLIFIAKAFKKKVILLGQGIGPVRRKWACRKVLKGVDLITVRDESSINELAKIGVKAGKIVLTADLSLLLNNIDKVKANALLKLDGIQKCKSNLIGISLRSVKAFLNDGAFRAIAAFCDDLIKNKDSQLVFLIFKYPEDLHISRKVMGYMKYPSHVFFRQCKPSDMLSVISTLDALIGMRLHSLIFASLAGVPALGISYDPKVASFQKMVHRPFLDIKDVSGSQLSMMFDKVFAGKNRPNPEIATLIERSEANYKYLFDVISRNKIDILGVEVDNVTSNEALLKIEKMLSTNNSHFVVTPNPEMMIEAQSDFELRSAIKASSLALADGVGLMIAARVLGKRFKERVAGIDLMRRIIDLARSHGHKIFLYGGKAGVAENAAKRIGGIVVGTQDGYCLNEHAVISAIKDARPDILFVGLGSPKQEKWAYRHMRELNVPLIMCVGGSLDVISGKTRRAPKLMRRLGLEWLWRLILEPRRWKRMLKLPLFMLKIIRYRIFN